MLEGLKVVSSTFIDRKHKHLRVKVVDQTGVSTEVLWWNAHTPPENEFDLAFQVVRSARTGFIWNGWTRVQPIN
jgi:hypothetical protein